MELGFDKEIDAILRNSRVGRGVLVGDDPPQKPPGKHLEADEIAAFAENALPAKSRALYMTHIADCDRCRRVLSGLMMLNAAAEPEKASAKVAAPVVEIAVPWYQKLFRTPNLAMVMGALVLVFGGFLGFLALRENSTGNSTVAVVTEPERTSGGGPFTNEDISGTGASNYLAQPTNSAANIAAAPAQANANKPVVDGSADTKPVVREQPEAEKDADVLVTSKSAGKDDKELADEQPKPKTEAPASGATTPMGGVPAREEERSDDRGRVAAKKAAPPPPQDPDERSKLAESRATRDAPPAPAKSGPARSGPMNTQQNQIATQNMAEMPVTRKVGGRTFNNRDGVWYDSAYKSQATMNFRRGTDEYKGLDSGLRSIADALGGTVVVVWKEKAYRIR